MYMRTASLDPCKATLPRPPSSSLTLPGATTRHRRDHSRGLLCHHSAGPTVTIEVRSPAEPPVGELLLVDLSVPIAIKQAHRGFRLDSRQRAAEGLAKLLELICGLGVATAGQQKRWSERRPPATRLVRKTRDDAHLSMWPLPSRSYLSNAVSTATITAPEFELAIVTIGKSDVGWIWGIRGQQHEARCIGTCALTSSNRGRKTWHCGPNSSIILVKLTSVCQIHLLINAGHRCWPGIDETTHNHGNSACSCSWCVHSNVSFCGHRFDHN